MIDITYFHILHIASNMSVIRNKTVLDLSRIIVGPYATMLLADFGCRVIKVEAPEGDPTRVWGPPWYEN